MGRPRRAVEPVPRRPDARARARIGDEVTRLGGSCAHVVDEVIAVRRDDGSGDFWLSGTFRYVMYVHPPAAITP